MATDAGEIFSSKMGSETSRRSMLVKTKGLQTVTVYDTHPRQPYIAAIYSATRKLYFLHLDDLEIVKQTDIDPNKTPTSIAFFRDGKHVSLEQEDFSGMVCLDLYWIWRRICRDFR